MNFDYCLFHIQSFHFATFALLQHFPIFPQKKVPTKISQVNEMNVYEATNRFSNSSVVGNMKKRLSDFKMPFNVNEEFITISKFGSFIFTLLPLCR